MLAEFPCGEAGDPICLGRPAAVALRHFFGQLQRFGRARVVEIDSSDVGGEDVALDRIHQSRDRCALGQVLAGALQVAAAQLILHVGDGAAHLGVVGRTARQTGVLGRREGSRGRRAGHHRRSVDHGPDRRLGGRRAGRAALYRQLMDALCVRLVVVLIEPTLQLGIGRAVGGWVQVALVEDVPQQHPVLQIADFLVGVLPLGVVLQREDAAIGCGVLGRQLGRDHRILGVGARGDGHQKERAGRKHSCAAAGIPRARRPSHPSGHRAYGARGRMPKVLQHALSGLPVVAFRLRGGQQSTRLQAAARWEAK